MADQLQRIHAMDGEMRLWRDIGGGAHAEVMTLYQWAEVMAALGSPTLGTAAQGSITCADASAITPVDVYQAGDTIRLNDGVNTPTTFEFYTLGEAAVGAIYVLERLANGDTLTVSDWSTGGHTVTFIFLDDPVSYVGPHTPVQRVPQAIPSLTDANATAVLLLAAIQASALDVTAILIHFSVIYLINNTEGAGGNTDITVSVAWDPPDMALFVFGMLGGADDTEYLVTAGNVAVAWSFTPLADLETAINAAPGPLAITATLDDTTLLLVNDAIGAAGTQPIVVTTTETDALVAVGMAGGTDASSGIFTATTPPGTLGVYNVAIAANNTEYSLVLAGTVRRLAFRSRNSAALRHSNVAGRVATPVAPYLTVPAGTAYDSGPLLLEGATWYFAGSAGDVVEVEAWS